MKKKQELKNEVIGAHKDGHSHGLFDCLLTETPAPISKKVTDARNKIARPMIKFEEINADHQTVVYPDMIIGDLLKFYPFLEEILTDLHPLATMSPSYKNQTLELFFADQPLDIEKICSHMTNIIASKSP